MIKEEVTNESHNLGKLKKNNKSSQEKRFENIYYNCRKKSHMSEDCWFKKKFVESDVATSKKEMEDE